jgi:glycosyltransferase involved in cell wall biosynthesis
LIKPKVTLGVCVRNCEDHVKDVILSITGQDFSPELMEVIFVDDGSTDKTLLIIESYVPKMNMRVKIFRHEWKGLGYSRNVVVNNANGEYVIWVDGDMSLSKDFVRKQVEFMDGNPDVGIGKGRYGIHHATSLVAYLENIEVIVEFLNCEQKTLFKPLGTGGSIYRVEAIRKVGGFDENIKGVGEDMDAEYRIRTSGWLLQTTTAEFYEKQRENWKDLWNEYIWHGSGGRIIFNKVSPYSMLYKMFPPTIILTVISRSCNAYKLTHKKVVFLLPLHWIFKRVAWCLGFVMGM